MQNSKCKIQNERPLSRSALRRISSYFCILHFAFCIAASAAESKGKDDDIVDRIGNAPLEVDTILQSGALKVPTVKIEKVEQAYVAATRRQHPRYTLPPDQQIQMRKHFAVQFMINALLEKYAAEKKLTLPQAEFDDKFAKMKKSKITRGNSYEQHLLDSGLTDEEFRKYWDSRWAVEKDFAMGVTDAEVEAKLDFFMMPENLPLRRPAHILFTYTGANSASREVVRTKEQARTMAAETLKKLREGGDFAQLAKQLSDCPSKEAGGDLQFKPRREVMAEPLARAVYDLPKAGELAPEPIETDFGFHVVKLLEVRQPDDARAELFKRKDRAQLMGEVKGFVAQEKFNNLLKQIVETAAVNAKFNSKIFDAIEKKDPLPR